MAFQSFRSASSSSSHGPERLPPSRLAALGPLLGLSAAALLAFASCERVEGCEYTGDCPQTGGLGGAVSTSGTSGTSGTEGQSGGAESTGGTSSTSTGGNGNGLGGNAGEGTGGSLGGAGSDAGGAFGGAGMDGGVGGQGGIPEPEPCDGQCFGNKPLCNAVTDQCVQCLLSTDCASGNSTGTGGTAGTAGTSGNTNPNTPHCKPAEYLCVECLLNTHCSSPEKSRCDGGPGKCVPCVADSDCDQISGKSVCDAGECVECTAQKETEVCGEYSCNPATKTCTETERHTVGICEKCVADSECEVDGTGEPEARCVPMKFGQEWREGGYCLSRRAKLGSCARPYLGHLVRESLSGAPEETYCSIREELTTCEAVLDFVASRPCQEDASCGCEEPGNGESPCDGKGGLCRPGTEENLCTYPCLETNDCRSVSVCTSDPDPYCSR